MRRFLPLLCLLPLAGAAAAAGDFSMDEGYLDKSLNALGGYARYQRLETVRYDFMETSFTQGGGPINVSGRHYFKLHDKLGFRGRVETSSPLGETLTLFTSSGIWHWDNGRHVTDPLLLARIREDVLEKALWVLGPFGLKEVECGVTYGGLSFLENRLMRRLDVVVLRPAAHLPNFTDFSVYLDTGDYRVNGAVVPAAVGETGVRTVILESYVPTTVIQVPTRRTVLDAQRNRLSSFTVLNPVMNGYVDEKLLQPPADAPAPAPLPAGERSLSGPAPSAGASAPGPDGLGAPAYTPPDR